MAQAKGRTVIIGAGFAGAATAFGLVRRGVRDVLVLEQEGIPGFYASGRNAAMIRQLGPSPEARRLVRFGLSFYDSPPAPFPAPVGFKRAGSLLLASGKELAALRAWAQTDGATDPSVRFMDRGEVAKMIGCSGPESFEAGAFTSTDGVADIHALLNGFLSGTRAGGGEVRFKTKVAEIMVRNGRVASLKTDAGEVIECARLVNAAGPWAARIGIIAGAAALPFLTLRRHLAQTGPVAGVDASWPFVWNITHEVYFRPESGGVLFSPCDEGAIAPCDPPVDSATIEMLAHKVATCFPGLKNAHIVRSWACIRTFVSDREIVVGPDPGIEGFFWAAALGGAGVCLAPALSWLMPDLILDGRSSLLSETAQKAFSPGRF